MVNEIKSFLIGISKRLDFRFTVLLFSIFFILLALSIGAARVTYLKSLEQLVSLEKERIYSRLKASQDTLAGDLILGHNDAIEIQLNNIKNDLGLSYISVQRGPVTVAFGDDQVLKGHNLSAEQYLDLVADNNKLGEVFAYKIIFQKTSSIWLAVYFLITGVLASILIFTVVQYFINSQIIKPIHSLVKTPQNELSKLSEKSSHLSTEVQELNSIFWKRQIELVEFQTKNAVFEIASRLAHDIRSPIAALRMVMNDKDKNLSEEKIKILEAAAKRIDEIADSLLSKRNNVNPTDEKESFGSLVKQIVDEIKFLNSKRNCKINLQVLGEDLGLSKTINKTEFQRVLSNSLNNAIEAGSSEVKIIANAKTWGKSIIQIVDNGPGIPEHVLKKLGNEEISFGKSKGNGIGIFNAVKYLKSVGGQYQIDSTEKGTSITISF